MTVPCDVRVVCGSRNNVPSALHCTCSSVHISTGYYLYAQLEVVDTTNFENAQLHVNFTLVTALAKYGQPVNSSEYVLYISRTCTLYM